MRIRKLLQPDPRVRRPKRLDIIFDSSDERRVWLTTHFPNAELVEVQGSHIWFRTPNVGGFVLEEDVETVVFFDGAADKAEAIVELSNRHF